MNAPNAFNPKARAVPRAELLQHITDLVRAAPRTYLELHALTGYSLNAIRVRVLVLAEDTIIHCVERRCGSVLELVWHFGPAPVLPEPEPEPEPAPVVIAPPPPPPVRVYPVIGRRDWAVAALFGAPARTGMLAGILSGEG